VKNTGDGIPVYNINSPKPVELETIVVD